MPKDDNLPNISDSELELLKELWDGGATSVRSLHSLLETRGHTWAYTTVQTMLTRLEEKGYVRVDRSGIAHMFEASVNRDALLGNRLDELAQKICDGAAGPLLLNLVNKGRFSSDEISRFRRMLDEAERGEQSDGEVK